jgi:hypothetical protein
VYRDITERAKLDIEEKAAHFDRIIQRQKQDMQMIEDHFEKQMLSQDDIIMKTYGELEALRYYHHFT